MTTTGAIPDEGVAHSSFPLHFRGRTRALRDEASVLGLTLVGPAGNPDESVLLGFSTRAPDDLPDFLEGALIERLAARRYRIASGPRAWMIEGAAHVHIDVAREFERALPAREVPWRKRVLWRLLLAGAGVLSRMRVWRDPPTSRAAQPQPGSDKH